MWTRTSKYREAFVGYVPGVKKPLTLNCISGQVSEVLSIITMSKMSSLRMVIILLLLLPHCHQSPPQPSLFSPQLPTFMCWKGIPITPLLFQNPGSSVATPPSSCSSNRSGTLPAQGFHTCFPSAWTQLKCDELPLYYLRLQLPTWLLSRFARLCPFPLHLPSSDILCILFIHCLFCTSTWHFHQGRSLCGCGSLLYP